MLWDGLGRGLALASSVVVLFLVPSLPLLVVATLLPVTISAWVNAILVRRRHGLGFERDELVAFATSTGSSENWRLFKQGSPFLAMQVAFLMQASLDPYLANVFLGADSVSYISVARRPFDLIPVGISLFTLPMWPVFTRLHGRGETTRLLRTVTAGIGGALFVALAGCLAILALQGPIYDYLGAGIVSPMPADLRLIAVQTAGLSVVLVLNV